jgi:hypothetical protein
MNGENASFASPPKRIRLETILLRDLLSDDVKIPSGLSTCYFVTGSKLDKVAPRAKREVPAIDGVFSISGKPPDVDREFEKPLGGIAFGHFVNLLNKVTFTVTNENSGRNTNYKLVIREVPPAERKAAPSGADSNTIIAECSLLDISFLVQNYLVTVQNLSNGTPSGPYRPSAVPSSPWHTNLELGLEIGPMTLDCVVSYLSLFDLQLNSAAGGTGIRCFYGNKVHGL